ncbi:MAG: hypothetical protein ACO1RX_17620 [Candidatus Sericytochromatia bacterium]
MPNLRPLNEIMPQQQPVYQQQPQQAPQQPAYQQPVQPQQYPQQPQYAQQPAAPSNTYTATLQNTSQLDGMRNNGRVEIVVQDANAGYQVISTDQLNIAAIEMQNAQLGQELRLFDANQDGWIVEAELKATPSSQTPIAGGEQVSTFEHVASSTLGGGLFGGAVGTLAGKMGLNLGSKFGVKGWVAGAIGGAAVGMIGGFMTKPSKTEQTQQNFTDVYGYRPDTQWNNSRLIKTVL